MEPNGCLLNLLFAPIAIWWYKKQSRIFYAKECPNCGYSPCHYYAIDITNSVDGHFIHCYRCPSCGYYFDDKNLQEIEKK